MSDDDVKRLILSRRARFIAAAIASTGIAASGCDACNPPRPCLDVDRVSDGAPPMPCLSPPPESTPATVDAGSPPEGGADASAPKDAGNDARAAAPIDAGKPQVCLKPPPSKPNGDPF